MSEWFKNKENKEAIPNLLRHRVVRTLHYESGDFTEGWLLLFDNGVVLTARDGEYGDDAFKFISQEELERILKEHEEFQKAKFNR